MRSKEDKEEKNKQLVDFLRYTIDYLENRIRLLDSKASILIAAQGVVFAVFYYVIREIFLTPASSARCIVLVYVLLVGAFSFFILVVALLLETIRPATMFLRLELKLKHLDRKCYVMWPHDEFPGLPKAYKEKMKGVDESGIQENYQETHYVCLQLVNMKYRFYRWAVSTMKFSVLWISSGMGVVMLALAMKLSNQTAGIIWFAILLGAVLAHLTILKIRRGKE